MTNEEAKDRIRRLLALGTSANEHEAQAALAKAAELARKYSVDLGSVADESDELRVVEKSFEGSARAHTAIYDAAIQICMQLFAVRCLRDRRGKTPTYIGLAHNVETAVFAHGFILAQCSRDLKRHRRAYGRGFRAANANGYCDGWKLGVLGKFRAVLAKPGAELEDAKNAIVLVNQEKKVADYMEENHGHCPKRKTRARQSNTRSWMNGLEDGKKVNLSRPIEDAQKPLALE